MRRTRKIRNKGFTLVELIVVLAIVSLFTGVAIATINSYRSRRGRDVGDAALILRATLRAARAYAIQNRVTAGVVFDPVLIDPGTGRYCGRRYHIEYQEKNGEWVRPLGLYSRDTVLRNNLSFELDDRVLWIDDTRPAHIFDPTGTLDNPSALKAVITMRANDPEVSEAQIEILRPTGRVRIR